MNWSTKIALALAASAPAMAQQDDPKRQLLPRDKYDPCQENREQNIWKFQSRPGGARAPVAHILCPPRPSNGATDRI
jgi:hypothetical protein